MSNQLSGRRPSSMTQATRIALTLAACSLAVAVYYYTASTHFVGHDGSIFGCGSPMSPNEDGLAKGQCGILERGYLHKAFLFLGLAVILTVLGFLLFGAPRDAGTGHVAEVGDGGRPLRSGRRARLGDEDVAPVAEADRVEAGETVSTDAVPGGAHRTGLRLDSGDEVPRRHRSPRRTDEG